MKSSLIISGFAHGAILFWAVTGISAPREFKVEPIKSIPVNIMTASEFTRIKAGTKKGLEKKASVSEVKPPNAAAQKKKSKSKAVKAVRPPKQEEEKVEALPKPKPKPKKTAKPKPKPKKKTTKKKPKKKITRQSKSKKSFDKDRIAALLNKIPDAGGAQQQKAPVAPKKQAARGHTRGRDATLSANEIAAMQAQISQCWNPPIGGVGAERIVVKIKFQLNKDGTLKQPPKVVNSMSAVSFQPAADSAVRAIWQCQPYNMFNPKTYKTWKEMTLNFDPREMYGG